MPQTQTATINVRVDENVKREVEQLFDNMGMNISTAVNMFFRQCLMEEALPFQPRASHPSLRAALKEAQEQAKATGVSELTLEDINSIVSEVRREYRS